MRKLFKLSRVTDNFLSGIALNLTGVAVAAVSVSTLTSLIPLLLKENINLIPRTVLYVLLAALSTGLIISFFVFLLKKRTEQISRLKREVAGAFISALEQSSFNPHRLEGNHERHSAQTTK